MSIVKEVTSNLRYALLDIDFGINNRFYNSEELEKFWQRTRIPDCFMKFLCDLNNTKKNHSCTAIATLKFKNDY